MSAAHRIDSTGSTPPPPSLARRADLLSAGRTDLLRATADGLRLARREITVDESVLRTQNLAVFL